MWPAVPIRSSAWIVSSFQCASASPSRFSLRFLWVGCTDEETAAICREDATELFDRRIAPVLVEDRPKTCNQCHLSGVDLSIFVRDTPCETMACMVELEIVDLDSPDDSLVLSWIDRAMPDSELITDEVISAEHDAFRDWIIHTAECGGLEACGDVDCGPAEPGDQCEVRGDEPDAEPFTIDPMDCSPIQREETLLHQVYAFRGRCFPCHFIGSEYGRHDAFHAQYGEGDEVAIPACEADVQTLPHAEMPVMSGNFIECRQAMCDAAATDDTMCAAALGGAPCM